MRTAILLIVAGLCLTPDAEQPCDDCVEARYWQVDPAYWSSANPDVRSFPEWQSGAPPAGADFGVAFSGGGTRSAAATVGQLRGLVQNGWLPRVRYVTAVSGGSWAAVPFTYFSGPDLGELLGTFEAKPGAIDPDGFRSTPNGRLALQITRSKLAATGLAESLSFVPDRIAERDVARLRAEAAMVRDLARRLRGRGLPDPTRQNKTFARLLGQIFIDPLVKDGNRRPFGWTLESALAVSAIARLPQMDFQQAPESRPFLIVGGTIISNRDGLVYPRLIPIEYTPLYVGVRQQFGNLGGTYVMPWAYDRTHAVVRGDRVVVDRAGVRMFTLADVIGSSGAAPQLQLMLTARAPAKVRGAMLQAAGAFPAFRPFAVRDGKALPVVAEIAHGDGGFTDNLGLMPLLARGVRHIVAFVNSNKPHTANEQLQSYFYSLAVRGGSGDKSMNAVFPRERYRALVDGLSAAVKGGGPAIFCDTTSVLRNELYNIAALDGLKVCWVYNAAAADWRAELPQRIQTWLGDPKLGGLKSLRHFPYYDTFAENRPYMIKLDALQVNLLANLSAWAITTDAGRSRIEQFFGAAVFAPKEAGRAP